MQIRGNKKDLNHDALVAVFKELGCSVMECHSVGIPGFPDLVVGCLFRTHLVEVKNPETSYGRKGLNAKQEKFNDSWRGGKVQIVRSSEDVIGLVNRWRKEAEPA
jgi:hypothetical protein